MNEFEGLVDKRNDAIDTGIGFAVSIGFFTTMFIIAIVIKAVGA